VQRVVGGAPVFLNAIYAVLQAGALLKSEIEAAFKIAAKGTHPDGGGSNEQFKQLLAAKDALIKQCGFYGRYWSIRDGES
jgi:hypothetical protein